jgi:hypothetical protein
LDWHISFEFGRLMELPSRAYMARMELFAPAGAGGHMEHSARNDDVNALIILVILCLLGLIIISGCIFLAFWI